MQQEFQQYRFARIEGHNITRGRLEAQFTGRIAELDEIEKAVAQQLATKPERCAPWRTSEIEQTGYSDGVRMAALEFFWAHRHEKEETALNNPKGAR